MTRKLELMETLHLGLEGCGAPRKPEIKAGIVIFKRPFAHVPHPRNKWKLPPLACGYAANPAAKHRIGWVSL